MSRSPEYEDGKDARWMDADCGYIRYDDDEPGAAVG